MQRYKLLTLAILVALFGSSDMARRWLASWLPSVIDGPLGATAAILPSRADFEAFGALFWTPLYTCVMPEHGWLSGDMITHVLHVALVGVHVPYSYRLLWVADRRAARGTQTESGLPMASADSLQVVDVRNLVCNPFCRPRLAAASQAAVTRAESLLCAGHARW
eukprot:SAG11_NODE_43_length_20795_cov_11.860456_9_plen_164_part_00